MEHCDLLTHSLTGLELCTVCAGEKGIWPDGVELVVSSVSQRDTITLQPNTLGPINFMAYSAFPKELESLLYKCGKSLINV